MVSGCGEDNDDSTVADASELLREAIEDDVQNCNASMSMPDEKFRRLRIHPSLIVNVVENWLNEDHEDGSAVTEDDIWYSKGDISNLRAEAMKHSMENDLTHAQDLKSRKKTHNDQGK